MQEYDLEQQNTNAAADQTSRAANDFQTQAGAKTDAATTQGKQDAATYLDQAKSLAGAALGTAHVRYLSSHFIQFSELN